MPVCVCHNVADKVLIRLRLTLLYTNTSRETDGETESRGRKWMDGWMDRLGCAYKQFVVATLDEPIICQSLSEYERKGSMDGEGGFAGSSLLLSSTATKHDEKCSCDGVCLSVCQKPAVKLLLTERQV